MNKIFLLISLAAISVSGMAQTAEENTAVAEVAAEASEPLAAIRLANHILRYGYENQSAIALASALQIISETPTQPIDATKEGDFVDKPEKKAKVSYDYATVLSDAKALAQGDANLLAVINNVAADAQGAQRGNTKGPSRDVATIAAKGLVKYVKGFEGKKLAEITVSGDGSTDLDLDVYDSLGRHISTLRRTDAGDCYVSWVPSFTQKYLIRITNRGGEANTFVILTN